MRAVGGLFTLILTLVAAAVIGFGVPLAWVWIGSQLQGEAGATSLDFSVAVVILLGIIATYVLVLWVAGMVMVRLDPEAAERRQRGTARNPWMRGMSDTRAILPKQEKGQSIERVFIVTTLVVTVAFWIWFFIDAGSPLPAQ
jgi:hypothetical protein